MCRKVCFKFIVCNRIHLGTASDGYGLSSYRDHYDRERFRPNRPSYEDAYYRAQETLSSTSMLPYYSQRHRGYRSDSGGYAPETESTDDYLMQVSCLGSVGPN